MNFIVISLLGLLVALCMYIMIKITQVITLLGLIVEFLEKILQGLMGE